MTKPVVSIVGKSKSGKTTMVCGLISELKQQGYKVATIKHDVHGFDIDKPGKDTWKHGEAGADTVAISSPDKMAMIEQLEQERSIDEILEKVDDDTDIILTEGYKSGPKPKIEVVRESNLEKPLCDLNDNLIAFACENKEKVTEQISKKFLEQVAVFSWNDYRGIANFLVNKGSN